MGNTRPLIVGSDSGPEPPYPLQMEGKVIKGFGRGSKEVSWRYLSCLYLALLLAYCCLIPLPFITLHLACGPARLVLGTVGEKRVEKGDTAELTPGGGLLALGLRSSPDIACLGNFWKGTIWGMATWRG